MVKIPFATEQFFSVFEKYNSGVFPFQWILFFTGCFIFLLLHFRQPLKNKLIAAYLCFLFLWSGSIYFINFFSDINRSAFIFGGFFILQGVLVLHHLIYDNKLVFKMRKNLQTSIGYLIIVFGLFVYPFISYVKPESDTQLLYPARPQ